MKKIYLLLFLLPCQLMAQNHNPDEFKSSKNYKQKSFLSNYYNPLLDKYDIKFINLDLNVTDQSTYLIGFATINAKVASTSLDTLVFDFKNNMLIDSVYINGSKRMVVHANNEIRYVFQPALLKNDDFSVTVYYKGIPSGGGITSSISSQWGKRVTWTLSESFHAYEWWPCKQVLSDKIDSVYLNFTCDDDCKVGSNGLLKNEISLPNNKIRFEWKSYCPINYYLISFAVAEYQDYSFYANPVGNDPILIQNYIYNTPACLSANKPQIDKTKELIEYYSSIFGLYPFLTEKYGHAMAQFSGGMEHQTMTSLINFNYTLVAHELAHQWFGNYVTCASWQDIWINEGFASYAEYIALEGLVSKSAADAWMIDAHNRALQESQGSVYVPFSQAFNESRIFNYNLSYQKGASIIHMIRHEINNDALFFNILKDYLNQYRNGVASGEDFKNLVEKKAGIDFDLFFDQWYFGKGYPRFDIEYTQHSDTLWLNAVQSTSSSETPLFQLFVDFKVYYPGGDTTLRLFQSSNNDQFIIPFQKAITSIRVDPENWILNAKGTVNSILQEHDTFLFKILQNPCTEYLILNFNSIYSNSEKNISIFSVDGRIIYKTKTSSTDYSLPVFYISQGLYYVKISCNNATQTSKFIKN